MKKLLLALVLSLPVSAYADPITLTVTGTISPWNWNGYGYIQAPVIDYGGVFGAVNASLTNDPFTVIWQFDTNHALIKGTLIINDHAAVLGANGYMSSWVNDQNGSGQSFVVAGVTVELISPYSRATDNTQMNTFIYNNGTAIPGGFQPFTYTFNPLTDNTSFPHQMGGAFNLGGDAKGYFAVETMTLSTYHTPGPVVGAGIPGLIAILIGIGLYYRKVIPCLN